MPNEFNYDAFLKDLEEARDLARPSYVICRSVEEAEAFAQWCIDNAIEDPLIAVQ